MLERFAFQPAMCVKPPCPGKQGLIKALRQGIMKARNPLIFDHMFSWPWHLGLRGMMLDYKIRLEMGMPS